MLDSQIIVTGNTVIDALFAVVDGLKSNQELAARFEDQFSFLQPDKRLVLVTAHRRESFGEGFERICTAIQMLAEENPDVQIVYPVHLNPSVKGPVESRLAGIGNVFLIEPLDYLPFVYLMNRSYFVLTDSGGVQEEAPSLGKPVLVMRENTERPEAVEAGTVLLVGTEPNAIMQASRALLQDTAFYETMSRAINPYGDGKASIRIAEALKAFRPD